MKRFFMGVGLALVFLLGGYFLEGGSGISLLALTPFLVTFFVPVFGLLAVWSFRDWARAWSHAFHPAGPEETHRSAELWKFLEFAAYLGGLVAFFVGGVLILLNLTNVNVQWNHSLAISLLSPIYGGFFGLIARVLRFRVEGGAE